MSERSNGLGGTHRALFRIHLHAVTGGQCAACRMSTSLDGRATDGDRAELGHVIPDALGGRLKDGAVILCRACNSDLGDTDLTAFLPMLSHAPIVPPSLSWLLSTYRPNVADRAGWDARRAARIAYIGR